MRLTVNGEAMDVAEGASVSDLVAQLDLNPKKVAVERNLQIVPRSQYEATPLADGDRIEIVAFVGGG
jgi:thiamine biosynthesis protein ThiS